MIINTSIKISEKTYVKIQVTIHNRKSLPTMHQYKDSGSDPSHYYNNNYSNFTILRNTKHM